VKLIESDTPDLELKDINIFKIKLLDKILYNVVPYINKDISEKVKELKASRKEMKKMRLSGLQLKKEIQDKLKILERKKKVKVLLDRAMNLVNLKALDENGLKSELSVMLRMIDDLPEEKIDFYVSEMMRILIKKFSNSEIKE
jgi:hypothetical protein